MISRNRVLMAMLRWWLALAVPLALLGSLLVFPSPVVPRAQAVGTPARLISAVNKAVADPDDSTSALKVSKAIEAGVRFLKQQQKSDGTWEVGGAGLSFSGSGGWTALAMLALLEAGVKPGEPSMQKGLASLRKVSPERTYVTGLQTAVFCLAGEKADHERIRRNVKALLTARMANGWSYSLSTRKDSNIPADNSNTQYALLGLHAANQSGVVKVDAKTLQEIRELFMKSQNRGGWGYRPIKGGETMTMTVAGLCNLMMVDRDLARGKTVLLPDGSVKNCGKHPDNNNITDALAWIGKVFPAELSDENIGGRFGSPFYCLHGIARAGRLTGQRYFCGHDWYEIGCRYLVDTQKKDGSWTGISSRATFDHWPVIATSFSLLFLTSSRAPILMSKMAYGDKDDMGCSNNRNDVRHLVEFARRELFKNKPLAWQAFDVRSAGADNAARRHRFAADLLPSPIVFFNGHETAPSGREAEILREYVAGGGFILAEACCGEKHFDRDFDKLMGKLFPGLALKPLEPEHPVWKASGRFTSSPKKFPLLGIKQGCRTVVIYSSKPITGYWESNVQDKGSRSRKAFELGANIIAYATGGEPPAPRLSRIVLAPDDPKTMLKRGYAQLGQLQHEDDWQPAAGVMRALVLEAMKADLRVMLKTQPFYALQKQVRDCRFLYLHGQGSFTEKKERLAHLRLHLEQGGMLFADASCGNQKFDAAFRVFIKDLFEGKLKLEPIPVNDELFGVKLNGEAIRTVRRRPSSADGKSVEREYKTLPPALEGIKYKGRWVVIDSKTDIGCALEMHSSPDCMGHDPASALRLARAAVLYALKR